MYKPFLVSLLTIFIFQFVDAQKKEPRLFDQNLIIHQCNIDITVNGIIATTFVELEFYNNKDKEEEGRYNFYLNPGQAITGLQLMLGDVYREGSIEEKWKARAAYGTIVGKRMDPALLQLIGQNYYSLNIYPVPAKGFRKVKIKIEEVLNADNIGDHYNLNFLNRDSIGKLTITALINGYTHLPVIGSGLLKKFTLTDSVNQYATGISYNSIANPAAIEFTVPVAQNGNDNNGFIQPNTGNFFVKLKTAIPDSVHINIKKLRVYWDCSASMNDSDKPNFIRYLKLVIAKYKPSQLTIVPFNQQVIVERIFSEQEINNNDWQSFIEAIPKYGATQFGTLKFNTVDDLILVFTDGKQTWGKKYPAIIQTPVVFITTAYAYNYSYDDYYNDDYYYNYEDDYNSINKQLPIKTYQLYSYYYYPNAFSYINNLVTFKTRLIAAEDEHGNQVDISGRQQVYTKRIFFGKLKTGSSKLVLKYGINDNVVFQQQIDFQAAGTMTDFDRAKILIQFEDIMKNRYWYNTLSFGIDNKILTWQTAFIVLEKVEDYIKYNITPPDDLLKECMAKGFVIHNYKQTFEQFKKEDALQTLKRVSTAYNKRILLWGDSTKKINLNAVAEDYLDIQENTKKENLKNNENKIEPKNLGKENTKTVQNDEVIVIGYSTQQRKDVTGAITTIRSQQLTDIPTMDVGEMLQGRVAGVEVIKASGEPGASSQITIRGVSSLSSNEPLYVIDGVAQPHSSGSFSAGNTISPYDIDNITVLKDAAAAAIYGASASGGVIVITTKRGRGYGYYNYNNHIDLKSLDDIDYMQQIKTAAVADKYETYLSLEEERKRSMGFYTDIALYFYEQGLTAHIDEILMKAAELSNNDLQSQITIAFIYEYMKQYDKAITIYQNLKTDYPKSLQLYRNLGWAYYQNKQPDSAVFILYNGITSATYADNTEAIQLKDIMLADMNMIIALHPAELHIDYIPKEIIKPIEADMRVLIESPVVNLYSLAVNQLWKQTVDIYNTTGENKQRLQIASYYNSIAEFVINKANKKRYSFSVSAYNGNNSISALIRIIKLKDFGKPTQSIDTDIVNLDNQYGKVVFEEFKIVK